ncbi:unnamed protein product [Kluyveromyces dobzhanskii CBS 2104]|uniref:non-specific serine/threonine protein kinase n=1 Tax=Kluyveromyces dobzhanskii CBS 2104 TaxID=1427455 RepID=A0A0A8L9V3_9SACH|nr:unnamed protein product [Kluyveromyces dobzhanskii CBS 2104]
MFTSKAEQHNIKAKIAASYDKLYSQFSSDELNEIGNYKISKFIGEGSFGKVYLATHKLTHQKVVLKTGNKKDPNVVREVFYHRQFDFPYITKLYEVIVTESRVWMVLEYCSGRELYEHLLKQQRLSLEESKKLFAQIVSAVYYAHELKCVHRDLKLENILLDGNGHAKLTDFGFTREMATRSQLETICGTTVYMAPELIQRKSYDGFKADIWSLGIILYTMINGYMPFDEDDDNMTKYKIVNEEVDFREGEVSDDTIDIIQGMLRKNPNDRLSLSEVLSHPFLQPWGAAAKEKTNKVLLKQRGGNLHFRSKHEKRLLKRLKHCGFDTGSIKNSVNKRKCDSLSGLWFLLQERDVASDVGVPKRTRSVLSVRKVFESSVNMVMDDILVNSPECVKSNSLKKIMSRKSGDQKIENQELPKLEQPNGVKVEELKDPKREEPESVNSTEVTNKKKGFLQRVSSLFRPKKHSTQGNINQPVDNHTAPGIQPLLGKRRHKTVSNESQEASIRNSLPATESADLNVQFEDKNNKVTHRVKKMKSHSSSEISKTQNGSDLQNLQLNESAEEILKISNNGGARRSSIVSQHSAISNDTYNSEYSTDAQSGFRSNNTQSSNRVNANSENLTATRKNVRRTLSVLSSASSTSEMSSRTDSFYDITTASSPMNMDIRSNYNARSDSQFPRINGNSPWMIKRGRSPIGRRTRINSRSLNRKFRHPTPGRAESVIQEESSLDENERASNLPEVAEYDSTEMAIHSDSETPSKGNTPLYTIGINHPEARPILFSVGRSMSDGSSWSHQHSDFQEPFSTALVRQPSSRNIEEDDYEAVIAADDEDNSLEDEEQEHVRSLVEYV